MSFTVSASATNGQDNVVLKVWAVTGGTETGGAVVCALQSFSAGPNPITPNGSGSVIVGAVNNDGGGNTAQTPGSNNSTDDSVNTSSSVGNAWYGHYTGTVTASTPVNVGTTFGAGGDYSYAIYEVKASGTAAIDASTPAAVAGTTSSATTASFTPPGGAVLVAIVTAVGTANQVFSISDTSGLGLTWTQRGTTATGGFTGSAAVFTTTVPGSPGAATAALSGAGTLRAGITGPPWVSLVGVPGKASATSATSLTGAYGQTPTAGNLLVAVIGGGGTTATAWAVTGPSGWTRLIASAVGNNTSGNDQAGVDVWYKVAAGGDAAPSFTGIGVGGTSAVNCTIFELQGAAAALQTSGTYTSGSTSGTVTYTATTAASVAAAGSFAISAFTQERTSATLTWTETGSGWTSAAKYPASGASAVSTEVNYKSNPATGSTLNDAGHFSTDNSAFGAGTVVVIPPLVAGAAVLSGAGSLTAAAAASGPVAGSAALTGTGTFTAAVGITGYGGVAALTGTGTFTATPAPPYIANLAGTPGAGWFADQYGRARLWVATETWGLPVNAGNYSSTYQTDYDTFFASRAAQGFTVMMTDPVWADSGQATQYNGNTWDGVTPLAGGSTDPSTAGLNSTFWTRIDYMMTSAAAHGITIALTLWDGDDTSNSSWTGHSWTTTQWTAWAQKIATRYASTANLVWLVGNDAFSPFEDSQWNAILTGLSNAGDTHLIAPWYNAECTSRYDTSANATEDWGVSDASFNFCYSYNAIYWVIEYAYTEVSAQGAANLLPVTWGDGWFYTGTSGSGYDSTADRFARQAWWWALASGSRGVLGEAENAYPWASTSAAAVTGDWFFAHNAANIVTAFTGLAGWNTLIPDTSNALVTAGRGTRVSGLSSGGGGGSYSGFTNSYVAASRTPDSGSGSTLAVLYLPNATTITIDQTKMVSGYTATWVDPISGATSSATAGGTYNSTAKGNNSQGDPDWVLVLAGTATSAFSGAAALTGSGTFSAASAVNAQAAATLSGAGTLTTTAQKTVQPAATLSGSGTFSATGQKTVPGAASLSGSGTLSAAAQKTVQPAAALSGSGTLTAAAQKAVSPAAGLSGQGTLTAAAQKTVRAAASLSGAGTFTVTAQKQVRAAVTLAGSGTFSATSQGQIPANATLAGAGTLTATGQKAVPAAAALAGSGTFTATAQKQIPAAAVLSGAGTFGAAGQKQVPAAAGLTGTGTFTGAAAKIVSPAAALTGSGTLTAPLSVSGLSQGAASLTGSGTLSAAAQKTVQPAATLTGSGTLGAAASTAHPAAGAFTGSGTLTAAAYTAIPASAGLSGTGTFTATAGGTFPGTAALSGLGSLSAASTTAGSAAGAAVLAGSGTLGTAAQIAYSIAAALTGSGTLSAAATPGVAAILTLTGSGVLTVASQPQIQAAAALAGLGNLVTSTQTGIPLAAALTGLGAFSGVATLAAAAAVALSGTGVLIATPPAATGPLTLAASDTATANLSASDTAAGVLAASDQRAGGPG